MLVPEIFLIGGTFKSPELNAFPKFELLRTLLSFLCPWAPTSISVKQQLQQPHLTSTLSESFLIKIQKFGILWAFDEAVFPFCASYTIRHFTNLVELICNLQPFFRSRDCYIYWLQYLPNGFSVLMYNALYCILSNSKKVSQRRK